MTEAIELLDKQLQTVRNMLQGSRERLDKLTANSESEEAVIDTLKRREIQLTAAINKLRD